MNEINWFLPFFRFENEGGSDCFVGGVARCDCQWGMRFFFFFFFRFLV
jgi:hypothetical protein